jgi:alanine or glycine:cation symporter, AGCS family
MDFITFNGNLALLTAHMKTIADFIWSYPLVLLLIGTGLWLTFALRGIQFTKLGHALKLAFFHKHKNHHEGDISHFQALTTALAATVGTGNIVGVATAISIGGPGALFWMWITGLVGMATKYSEAILGVKYRVKNKHGQMSGGPMYYITKALKYKWIGMFFAFMLVVDSFGAGNLVQSNSIASVLNANFGISLTWIAVILMIAVAFVTLKGIKTIGKVTEKLVPFMIVIYFVGALTIILFNLNALPSVFSLIFKHAFTKTAATGGFLGSAVIMSIRMGVSRGLFSNESGLGTGPIAAAAAKTEDPATQALISMTQTFIDTIIVCSMTGIVIILTGVWKTGLNGAPLTSEAFSVGLPAIGNYIVVITLVLFAYSTIIGWSYYGEKAVEFVFGHKSIIPFRIIYILFVGLGSMATLEFVWAFADISVALMALPNLLALIVLTPIIQRETKKYFRKNKNKT